MATKDMTPELNKLESHIDSLEEALKPLMDGLPEMSNELPLLDKAKMFALTAYAVESLLFSSLRLQGVKITEDDPVMKELKRVKQYFGKIKAVEEAQAPQQRTMTVNTEAATRILKADLGDDKTLKKKLEEKLAEERAKALLNTMQKTAKRPAPESPSASSSGPEKKQKSSRRGKGKKNKS